jgi:hypothetical protein
MVERHQRVSVFVDGPEGEVPRLKYQVSLRGAQRRSNLDGQSTIGTRLLRFARNDSYSGASGFSISASISMPSP